MPAGIMDRNWLPKDRPAFQEGTHFVGPSVALKVIRDVLVIGGFQFYLVSQNRHHVGESPEPSHPIVKVSSVLVRSHVPHQLAARAIVEIGGGENVRLSKGVDERVNGAKGL